MFAVIWNAINTVWDASEYVIMLNAQSMYQLNAKRLQALLLYVMDVNFLVMENANILKVVDHHKLALATSYPLFLRFEPVGCTETILCKLYEENGVEISKEIVKNEIFRQRDKSNNNDIGYFHQKIFQYIKKCHVPNNGEEGGWDVIYKNADGITLPGGDVVHNVYVEMKNKHNTMNSASAGKTYIKMQNQLLKELSHQKS